MKFLCAEKISQHKFKTPEGYLVCVDSVLARTGKQTYKRSEIFGCDCKDAENEVEVDRTAEEVFSDATLASFENKPLTIEHPDEDVNTSNHRDLAVGFARDIKRGKDNGQDVMLGTLVFTDAEAINAIESGEMVELSCGYDADIDDEENPCQRNIRGNHIALCQRGRAGNARIVDSKVKDEDLPEEEDSEFLFRDAYGKEIIVTNWDGRDQFMIVHEGREQMMSRRDVEQYLDRKGARFVRVLRDSVKDSIKDDALQKGKTYITKSGATLKITDLECSFSDYNGEATVMISYEYVSASGNKRGRGKANSHDFWKMLTDKSMTGDSVKDSKWFDPEYDKYVDESYIRRQYENFKKNKYFKQTYEQFREENFIEVKPGMERYFDSVKDDIDSTRRKLEEFVSRHPGKVHHNSFVKMTGNKYSCVVAEEDMAFVKNELNRMGFNNVRQSGGKHVVFEDSGLHQEQLAQKEYDEANKRLNHLYEQRKKACQNNYSGMHFEPEIAELEKKIAKLKKDFGYALGDSMKDRLQEVSTSIVSEFENNLRRYGLKIDGKGRTWSGRLHYQVSAEMSSESFIDYLERLEHWVERQGVPMTFSANCNRTHCTAGIDLDKQYVNDMFQKDVDTYEEATNGLKKQAKEAMRDKAVNTSTGEIHAWLERGKYRVSAYNRNNLNDAKLQEIARKHNVKIINADYGYVNVISDNKNAIYKAFAEINPKYSVGSWSITDSKEDILQKIRTTQIREGDTFEMRDGQYLVQIQNTGAQELSTRSGPLKTNGKNESLRLSVKLSSHAWGRIWKNGTIVFNETGALNIVRDKMIQFMKTVRDSKRR